MARSGVPYAEPSSDVWEECMRAAEDRTIDCIPQGMNVDNLVVGVIVDLTVAVVK